MKGSAEKKNVHETLSRQLLPYMKKGVRNNIREEKEGELSTLHLVAKRCLERLSLSPSPRCPSPPTATCDRKERRGGSTLNSKTPPASFSSASSAESGEGGRDSPGGRGGSERARAAWELRGDLAQQPPTFVRREVGAVTAQAADRRRKRRRGGTYFCYLSPGGRSVVGW